MRILGLSIDRLAVVGTMRMFEREVAGKIAKQKDSRVMEMLRFDKDFKGDRVDWARESLMYRVVGRPDYTSPVYNYRWKVGEHGFVQVNTLTGAFRVEWNPNKVEEDERVFINELLYHVEEKEFTRIDLALDVTDVSFAVGWEVIDHKHRKRKTYEKGSGELETRGCGTYNSECETVIYDKEAESGEAFKGVWRIEERLRGKKAAEWERHKWYEGVEIVKKGDAEIAGLRFPEGTKAQDKASVIACMSHPVLLEEFSKPTQRKIKKLMKEVTKINAEEVIKPAEIVAKEKSLDLAEIKGTLTQILKLGSKTVYHDNAKDKTVSEEKAHEQVRKLWEDMERINKKYGKAPVD